MSDNQATRTQATAEAILAGLAVAGDDEVVIVGALGAIVGCIAVSTSDPRATLARIAAVANGVISGELLDPPA